MDKIHHHIHKIGVNRESNQSNFSFDSPKSFRKPDLLAQCNLSFFFSKLFLVNNSHKSIISHKISDIFMGFVSLLTFMFIMTRQKEFSAKELSIWLNILIVLSSLIMLEMLIKMFILGRSEFCKHYFYLYELITSTLLFIYVLVGIFNGSDWINSSIVDIFVMLRVIRVFYLLLEINSFKQVFESLVSFLPFMLDHLAALFAFYCFFAILGVHLFGGLVNKHQELSFSNGNSYATYYYYSNFNDFLNSFLILFSLMIINNWNNQVSIQNKKKLSNII